MTEQPDDMRRLFRIPLVIIIVVLLAFFAFNIVNKTSFSGGIETYEWVVVPTTYCENETLELTTEVSIEDMAFGVMVNSLRLNTVYILFQHETLNDKGFYHEINKTNEFIWIKPAPRNFALYRRIYGRWIPIIEVFCEGDFLYD